MATSRRGARWFCLAAVAAAMALLWLGGGAAHSADAAPTVTATWPEPGALDIPLIAATDGSLSVTFSEPVALEAGALEVGCERSGRHLPSAVGGPVSFSFVSDRPFLPDENCLASVMADKVADLDDDDPPNRPLSELDWLFRTTAGWPVINELDALTAEGLGEFVELYDGGRGHTDLSGLSLVFFGLNGSLTYLALGLDGYRTDEDGYFLVGDFGLAEVDLRVGNGIFLDEAVAVALYDAPADTFPWMSPVPALEPIDAVAHGSAGPELMALLRPGEAALDENGRLTPALDSSQRCPDGAGLPRVTAPFILSTPTPGVRNLCPVDAAPEVAAVAPAPDARRVPLDAAVEIEFSEEVTLDGDAIELACSLSGRHTYTVEGGGRSFRFIPDSPFLEREACAVTVFAMKVADLDGNGPPDRPTTDYVWDFTTLFTVAGNVLINEVDTDTPGNDTTEFIELYDGGTGHTSLDGLSLLLFTGEDDRSYATLALDGYATDEAGYFVAGNAAVAGVGLAFADGLLQNGPDAVALVVGDGLDYPDGTPVTATVPFDAFVYARPNQADPGLQPLLELGQPQVDEIGRGNADAHSSQRCPNGTGGLRMTAGYKQNTPTPGAANDCLTDTPPSVQSVTPAHGSNSIGRAATLTVTFDEPVALAAGWLVLTCNSSGEHAYTTTGGPKAFTAAPNSGFNYAETCTATIRADRVTDADADDPPDTMSADWGWSFTTAAPPPNFILINEIDADTPGNDTAEFIELYDGGVGRTRLDWLTLVFFNGNGDQSYRAIDLDGQQTDAGGYIVIGNTAIAPDLTFPDGSLQNGPDAVALYAAAASQFPTGTAPRTADLIDAIVYGDRAGMSPALLGLLLAGQNPVDEGARGAAAGHSLQRCPNGTGGQRQTAAWRPSPPTPDRANVCTWDTPPSVQSVAPPHDASGIGRDATLTVTFDEPVVLAAGWLVLTCGSSGKHAYATTGGPQTFTVTPSAAFQYNETCTATILADRVTDADADDPPDAMAADWSWSFITADPPPGFILINEIDADTPGSDTAEFIELYDGGVGRTRLDWLTLVFFNGNDDQSYRVIDLDGQQTDAGGYLVIGNAAVAPDLTLPDGMLQNGPDAVALYAADASQFPTGTAPRTADLIDAIVYGDRAGMSPTLLGLLLAGQNPVDEGARGAAADHSLQRCPNGTGGQRQTAAWRPSPPTAGKPNVCTWDKPPEITTVFPRDGATGVDRESVIEVAFSEDVVVTTGWITIVCQISGAHAARVADGPRRFKIMPANPFAADEICHVTLDANLISDADVDDPPDHPVANNTWSFRTSPPPPPPDDPPAVVSYSPGQDAVDVYPDAPIKVTFSEDVAVDDGWLAIECATSGAHPTTVTGGPRLYAAAPVTPYAADEVCEVTITATFIHDTDANDPPDSSAADVAWRFRTLPLPVVHFTANGPLWIGETAVFSATVTGPGPLTIHWTFGDGDAPPAGGLEVLHRYAAVGRYVVRLEVTNPAGMAVYQEIMKVRPRAVYWPVMAIK